ncbi:transposase [Aphelenchoides avenae]|nr:transposase [Aphelenchus avenae]
MTNKPSVVWEFFLKNDDSMVCKLCPDDSDRGKLKGTLAANAKKHLLHHHKVEHEDVVARDANRIVAAVTATGSRKEEAPKYANPFEAAQAQVKKPLDRKSAEWSAQERNLACFLAKPTVPVGIVEDKAFRRFIYGFDKRYMVPKSDYGAKSVLARQASATKEALKKRLQAARSKFSVVVDIWSVSHSAYVGVTMHFIGSTGRLEVCFLGVRDIEGVKTAERVRECVNSILKEFQLSDDDVAFYVTDNGSNLLKAYRDSVEEVRIVICDDDAQTPGATDDDEADDEDSDGEQRAVQRYTPRIRATYADPQIEETDYQDESDEDANAEADVTEFETLEREYDATFAKRVSCFDHCLELVLKKVIEKDNKKASSLMRSTRAILRKV